MKNIKKIVKEFNLFASNDSWENSKLLKVSIEKFNPMHLIKSGRNGVSTVLELQNQVIEADSIHIDKYKSVITLYINSKIESEHGFGRYKPVFVQFKKGNKIYSRRLIKKWNREDNEIGSLQSLFGYDISNLYPIEFQEFIKNAPESKSNLKREFTDDIYNDVINSINSHKVHQDTLNKLCQLTNVEIKTMFEYTHEFCFSPKFINSNNKSLEFGFETHSTYNSLPVVIRIQKTSEIKTVLLKDLNIEKPGYYSHSDNMGILPSQVKQAKKFMTRFKNSEQKAFRNIKKEVQRLNVK